MPGFLLHLAAPWQAWPASALFTDQRPTMRFPTRSALTGLIGAALGIRHDPATGYADLSELDPLQYAVRIDQPGSQRRDYHTAGGGHVDTIHTGDGGPRPGAHGTLVSHRWFLANAAFTVAVTSADADLANQCARALRAPVFALYLGRRGFPPSYPPLLRDGLDDPAEELHNLPLHRQSEHGEDDSQVVVRYVLDADPQDGGPPPSRIKDVPKPGRVFGTRDVWHRDRRHPVSQCLQTGEDWLDRLDAYLDPKATTPS